MNKDMDDSNKYICFHSKLLPQINQKICYPMAVMLQAGAQLGVQVHEICFGVTACKYMVPIDPGKCN